MKSKYLLRVLSLLALLVSLVPARNAGALPLAADPPPAGMFQLPWDLGIAWVAIDGIDNGTRRPLNSSHHWSVGGAIDFAPHNNMRKGEDTSRFWVAAAASGTVVAKSFCHVKIDHGNGWTTEYQFLANISVNVGDSVSRNQRLGIIADGVRQRFCPGSNEPNVPHLHFMLRPSVRNATLAGWEVNYLPVLNKTTFKKNGQAVGLFKPLLNTFDQVQIVQRGPIIWDTLHTGNVDAFRYERWSLALDDLTKFTLTATPTSGLTPLIVLLDSNGNEISRNPGTLTSTQPAGNYFVQIQPEAGSGSYTLLAQRNDLPSGPYVSTTVTPISLNIGQTAIATVRLNNVPAEGYASAEFTCTYNAALAGVGNIGVADLFGADPAAAINNHNNGSFIVAIAGSQGNKATSSGTAFTFNITGWQAGHTVVECKAQVSKGDNALTAIDFIPGSLTVLGSPATPTPSTPVVPPTISVESPTVTHSPTPDGSPTSTSTPTLVPSTPTVLPSVCDRAEFVAHVTVPNGTVVSPAATFTKTWRLKNLGPCTWTTSYRLVFFAGEPMGAVMSASFPANVAPGQTADFSLSMTAPNAPGTYRGYWMFMNANGVNFGIGPNANEPWFVEIVVSGPTLPPSLTPTVPPSSPTPTFTPGEPGDTPTSVVTPGGPTATPIPGTVFDFVANACSATWTSGAGLLPCPGIDGDTSGFILRLDHPQLETGAFDSRPGLLTAPQNVHNGYIQGLYPAFRVQNGDRFHTTITCESGAMDCYAAFRLDYLVGSDPVKTFWGPFLERYDGRGFNVDVDLSALAGKDVRFILTVLAAGPAHGDRALWVGPIIYRAGSISTPTPTFSFTPDTACDKAEFVADVITPPGTVLLPGSIAGKTWLVKNVGSCTWTPSYGWIFAGGDLMDAPLSNTFAYDIHPGEVAEVYLSFTVPLTSGNYKSFWKLYNASGVPFGIGDSGTDPLVLDIVSSGPTVTPTIITFPTLPTDQWFTFTNETYRFQFLYPESAQIVAGGNDNSTRINLPFVQGTNLTQKYLQMTVVENVDPCRSPLATSSIPQTSETVVINGITFLKETGEDGTAGHINKWTAYSTARGNVCVSLDFVLRAANPGVFTTPPPLYDELESQMFGQIVSSYQWLDEEATTTPTPGGFATPTPPTPGESPTPTAPQSTPVGSATPTGLPNGSITGTVIASKPVTVSLYDASDVLITSVTANPDGTFSLTAPAGTYTIRANASGFLRAEGSVSIPTGGTATKPELTLLAGDIDSSGVIDQFDALTIGMSYNSATPAEADLNNDSVINILDLERLADNYRKSAPQAWD